MSNNESNRDMFFIVQEPVKKEMLWNETWERAILRDEYALCFFQAAFSLSKFVIFSYFDFDFYYCFIFLFYFLKKVVQLKCKQGFIRGPNIKKIQLVNSNNTTISKREFAV